MEIFSGKYFCNDCRVNQIKKSESKKEDNSHLFEALSKAMEAL